MSCEERSKEQKNDLSSVWRTLSVHPTYQETFEATHRYLLTGEGQLRFTDRHFIAMMASSRHNCVPLVSHHRLEFLSLNETKRQDVQQWVNGLEKAPNRLQKLDRINKILAHRPWMLSKFDIQELTQSEESCAGSKWTLSELIHAITLLCHFHAFSSFVLGCGLFQQQVEESRQAENPNPEGDQGVVQEANEATEHLMNSQATKEEVAAIMKKMETLMSKKEELEMSELARRFEIIEIQEEPDDKKTDDEEGDLDYTTDKAFKYVDFIKRDNATDYPTIKITDFNWNDHVFPTIQQLYNDDISQLLDTKFRVISKLTYMYIGKYTSVDTTMFRRAVKNYVQCLFGIRHDDYDYAQINELLPRQLKKYIKTVCCYPERCTVEEYQSIMTDFLDSEKVHVCLLVCEARLQAALLYSARAINQFCAK